jgi:hypothetical protein
VLIPMPLYRQFRVSPVRIRLKDLKKIPFTGSLRLSRSANMNLPRSSMSRVASQLGNRVMPNSDLTNRFWQSVQVTLALITLNYGLAYDCAILSGVTGITYGFYDWRPFKIGWIDYHE